MTPEKDKGPTSGLASDFDTTAELWDRVVEDLAGQGSPCMETLERLVSEACQVNPAPPPDLGKPGK